MRAVSPFLPRALSGLLFFLSCWSPALAAPGVSLRWDQCHSDGGVANKTFACDTNVGSDRLVMSFVLGSPINDVSTVEARLILISAEPTLPEWWHFRDLNSCRRTSLTLSPVSPVGAVNCADWAAGNAQGGIGSYQQNPNAIGSNSAALQLVTAIPLPLVNLNANQEYFAGSVVIDHAKSVGDGACAGCAPPMCIVLDRMFIRTYPSQNDVGLFDPAFGTGSNFARWQNAQESDVQFWQCPFACNFGSYHTFTCALSTTPARGST